MSTHLPRQSSAPIKVLACSAFGKLSIPPGTEPRYLLPTRHTFSTMQFPQWWEVSDYLQTHSVEQVQDATKVPYVWALGKEGKTYYEALGDDPKMADAWSKGINLLEATQPVLGMFPFQSMKDRVLAEPQRPFVVDVGGGRGNALSSVIKECSGSYGAKMILQDLAQVLEGIDPVDISGVENMPHNFYDPQPVKSECSDVCKRFKLIWLVDLPSAHRCPYLLSS